MLINQQKKNRKIFRLRFGHVSVRIRFYFNRRKRRFHAVVRLFGRRVRQRQIQRIALRKYFSRNRHK